MNTYRKKIEQYDRKNLGHVSGYVSRERGATAKYNHEVKGQANTV